MILNAYQEQQNQESHKELSPNYCSKSQVVNHKSSNDVPIRIIKSFYKKDALASVNDSFLRLDENYASKTIRKALSSSHSTSSSIEHLNKAASVVAQTQNTNQNGIQNNSSSATSSSYSISSSSVAPNHRPRYYYITFLIQIFSKIRKTQINCLQKTPSKLFIFDSKTQIKNNLNGLNLKYI